MFIYKYGKPGHCAGQISTKKKLETFVSSYFFQKMVGTVGLEPTRDFSQRILSPLRLPIPPRPHVIGGSDQI